MLVQALVALFVPSSVVTDLQRRLPFSPFAVLLLIPPVDEPGARCRLSGSAAQADGGSSRNPVQTAPG